MEYDLCPRQSPAVLFPLTEKEKKKNKKKIPTPF
jgi:hypothetical protein